jgi:L-ascorbate metabolism protein UlaG (beta-lactamase superfamily)
VWESLTVTWWGHSTVTIELAGTRLVTDPVLVDRIGQLHRRRGPTPTSDAGRADAALVSHLHSDHLHLPSLRRLPASMRLVVPRGAAGLLRRSAVPARFVEVAVGDELTVGPARVRAVAARHYGFRAPWSAVHGPALGYLVTAPGSVSTDDAGPTVWFAGDTDLFDGMTDLGPVDLALVPVGGWAPALGPGHLDPVRAVEAVRRVRPRWAVPIHFGTFWPRGLDRIRPDRFSEPGPEFARLVADAGLDVDVRVLAPGETVVLQREPPAGRAR